MSERSTQMPGRSWTSLLGGKPPEATSAEATASMPEAVTVPAEEDDSSEYRAFTVNRVRSQFLEISYFEPRVGIEEGYLLSMQRFVQAQYIGHEHVVLHFTDAIFQIEGRGVRQLVAMMQQGALQTIQEWNAKRWPEPAKDQPKITRIRVMTPEQMMEKDPAGQQRERAGEIAR